MKVKAIRSFVDKYSMDDVDKGTEFEVTEDRFSELTAGPIGVFVEEIKEDSPKIEGNNVTPVAENPLVEMNFEKMNKTELIEYAKGIEIEFNMEMTKNVMIEILLKK